MKIFVMIFLGDLRQRTHGSRTPIQYRKADACRALPVRRAQPAPSSRQKADRKSLSTQRFALTEIGGLFLSQSTSEMQHKPSASQFCSPLKRSRSASTP